jgi:hypothetical protein
VHSLKFIRAAYQRGGGGQRERSEAVTGTFYLLAETDHARRFTSDPKKLARAFWVPRSVCPRTTKFPAQEINGRFLHTCQVEIEDWWWEKHTQPIDGSNLGDTEARANRKSSIAYPQS